MTWYYDCPAIVDLDGQKGPGDMNIKRTSRLARSLALQCEYLR
jgi:hypothetical protein